MSTGRSSSHNILLLIVLILAGVVIGALVASATKNIPFLSWLAYSKTLGLAVDKPVLLNLSVLKIAFGMELNVSVAQLTCVALALLLYRKAK
jgi:hypothetical protein